MERCGYPRAVVVRDGKLVYEHYFTGQDEILGQDIGLTTYDASMAHEERSISKSITSLIVGIAFDRGWLKDLDVPVFSFLPECADLRTLEKNKITLRDLLTMSAGFVWDERRQPYGNIANSERPIDEAPDPYRYIWSQPMESTPGAYYNYCGCSAALLGAILKKVSGKSLDELAQEELLASLGIAGPAWDSFKGRFRNGDLTPHAGFRLRPRDLAKIGQMVLDRGRWQNQRIVSADWIAQSSAPQINGEGAYFYGYQWWLGRSLVATREVDWAAGVGLGGQRLYIVPTKHLVVVVNAGLYDKPLQAAVGTLC